MYYCKHFVINLVVMINFAASSAGVVKLADTPDLGSGAERCVGSTPSARTFQTFAESACYSTLLVNYPVFNFMNITLEPISENHSYLTIQIDADDYKPQIEQELRRLRKNANIKGFRAGAAPEAMIRKLYGDGLKQDQIHKLLNSTIENYQKDNSIQFLGDLIPVNESSNNIDESALQFKFEVGIAPKPDLNQLMPELKTTRYKVLVPEDRIDEEVEHLLNRFGQSKESNEPIAHDDYVEFEAVELEGNVLKENGWTTQFPVLLNDQIQEGFKNLVLGKSKGDQLDFNVREIENELSEKDLDKYLLKLPEDSTPETRPGDQYRGTITKIMRKQKSELNEDFFKAAFGPETTINSEEELRAELRKNLENYFEDECSKLLDIELVKKLVKESKMNFPDDFLLKWLKQTYKEWNEKTGHDLDHEYLHFKEGMCWKLIREEILIKERLNVSFDEMANSVIDDIKRQYPGVQLPDDAWRDLAKRTLDNQEKAMHYYVEAQNRKALNWLRDQIQTEEQEMSLDQFREKVKAINEHKH